MTCRIRFHPKADHDFELARDWYGAHGGTLAEAFTEAVSVQVRAIASQPLAYATWRGELRRSLVTEFPYRILFRLAGDDVQIVAIVHTRRHPAAGTRRH